MDKINPMSNDNKAAQILTCVNCGYMPPSDERICTYCGYVNVHHVSQVVAGEKPGLVHPKEGILPTHALDMVAQNEGYKDWKECLEWHTTKFNPSKGLENSLTQMITDAMCVHACQFLYSEPEATPPHQEAKPFEGKSLEECNDEVAKQTGYVMWAYVEEKFMKGIITFRQLIALCNQAAELYAKQQQPQFVMAHNIATLICYEEEIVRSVGVGDRKSVINAFKALKKLPSPPTP